MKRKKGKKQKNKPHKRHFKSKQGVLLSSRLTRLNCADKKWREKTFSGFKYWSNKGNRQKWLRSRKDKLKRHRLLKLDKMRRNS